jgi:predicted nucleic acid-binding Zn ribbon protein
MNKPTGPEPIGSILEGILAERGYLVVCKELAIQQRWPEIAGEAVAAVTQCDRVENGVVYVRVSSSPWRQELVYLKAQLLEKIKKECSSIRDIVFS